MSTPTWSTEEIEKMREAVLQSDKAKITNNVFDLSKPPQVPYKYQEFPKLVYKHEASEPSKDILKKMGTGNEEMIHIPAKYATKTVANEKELKAAIKAGYQEDPPIMGHVGLDGEVVEVSEDEEAQGE